MHLKEITTLLHFQDNPSLECDQVNSLIDEQLISVANKIQMFEGLKEQLHALRNRCEDSYTAWVGDCPCHESG